MSFTRLTHQEREEIALGIQAGRTSAEIGAVLGRRDSTISREIRRHGGWWAYRPLTAQTAARRQATTAHRRLRLLAAHPTLLIFGPRTLALALVATTYQPVAAPVASRAAADLRRNRISILLHPAARHPQT